MKVLVTGGAGYIGSVVTSELVAAGMSPVAYDNLSEGHRGAVPENVPLVVADLADATTLADVLRSHDIEAVIHMAASALLGESMERPDLYFRNNVVASLTLLEGMREAGVKRMVFSSSAATYGEPEGFPIQETDRTDPVNPYGETKLIFEKALRWYDHAFGIRYASLRYFNAAGATPELGEDHDPETHLIPLILRIPLGQAEKIHIFGDDYPTPDGSCVRDYIHVGDLARAHVLALKRLEEGSGIYNLGNGNGYSVKEVIEAARTVTGHRIPAVVAPRRPGDPATLVASSRKAEAELGWKPEMGDLVEIVRSAWDWHREHPEGYDDDE
jgi:UDP-glucose 4-epimerase